MLKVSVALIAYNHEKFIRRAIESALDQKTDFAYEIVIGDDVSSDKTREIIVEYYEQFPDKVVPLLHKENTGGFGKGNTLAVLEKCRGQYIASMDGDDYWTDPLKLQKQVDFLDKNPDFVACFHNAEIVYDDGAHPNEFVNQPDQKEITGVEDLVGEDEVWYIATSSILYRHNVITTYPKWFHESKSGDIPRYILLGKNGGKFKYLNETMSVYRKNWGGLSFTDGYRDEDFLLNRVGMYKGIDTELDHKYTHKIKKNVGRYYRMLIESEQAQKSAYKKWNYFFLYCLYAKPKVSLLKEVIWKNILPNYLKKAYSFVALLPYRLSNRK